MATPTPEQLRARRARARAVRRRRRVAAVGLGLLLVSGAIAVGALNDDATGKASPRTAPKNDGPRDARVTISATGDITMGRTPVLPPDGGASLFSAVTRSLAADAVLGNLEGTLTNETASKCGTGSPNCFAFRVPPSYARHLKRAGFTVLNLANNHAYDFGPRGLSDTVAALRRVGLRETGRPGTIRIQRVGRVRVAFLGFAPYPWAQSLLDIRAAQRLVRSADDIAHVVVVTMHAGAEGAGRTRVRLGPETYLGEPRGNVVAFSRAVVDAGADLVVGHGPHVLRGMESYRGRLIAYSLGNFSGYRTFGISGVLGLSGILRVTLRGDGTWREGEFVSTRLVGTGTPVLDRTRAAGRLVDRLSRRDFGSHGVRVSLSGALLPRG